MSWFDDQGIIPSVPQAPPPTAPTPAPQQGQWAPTNQGFLDWATQTYGANPQGFVDPKGAQFQDVLNRYQTESGNQATYLGGPSGDRVDFGQGVQDARTSNGLLWNNATPGAGGTAAPGGGGGGYGGAGGYGGGGGGQLGSMAMPTAPAVQDLTAPAPFTYAPNTQGAFTAPGGVPTAPTQTYNPMAAPTALTATSLATPGAYAHQDYAGLSPADLASGPAADAYKWRTAQGLDALQNAAVAKGMARGGNTMKGLIDYGQGAASQEYAAADARARATNAMNNAGQLGAAQYNAATGLAYNQNANQNALGFGAQNFQQGFAVNQANNAGQAAAQQANFQNQLAGQGQGFNQALGAYGANQAAQNQGFNQALGAYGQNAQTGLAYGSQNQQNALANYQAQVNAALGLGNLNLGYTQAANQYNLGQGNLGVQQGQLDLSRQGQGYNQDLSTFLTNYQVNTQDPWNRNLQLAQLGLPTRPD